MEIGFLNSKKLYPESEQIIPYFVIYCRLSVEFNKVDENLSQFSEANCILWLTVHEAHPVFWKFLSKWILQFGHSSLPLDKIARVICSLPFTFTLDAQGIDKIAYPDLSVNNVNGRHCKVRL